MIDADDEGPRSESGPGFTEAVTFSFGDAEADLYGSARVGLSPATSTLSALAVVFSGSEPVAVRAEGGIAAAEVSWKDVEAAGLRARVDEPLRSWSTAFAGDDGGGFELTFTALAPAFEFGAESAVARSGGMEGYEHLCRVEGTVTVAGRPARLRCLGQRGHAWGSTDWERLERTASVSAWIADDRAFALETIRPRNAPGHDAEVVSLVALEAGETGLALTPALDPRLSTTYDADGRHRRASLEFWLEEEGYARRAAGAARCGTTLELGRLRMDSAFFAWTMDGEQGVGRYEVLRRA
jgi:hypothetical protein